MPSKSKSQARLMAACSHGADYPSCPPKKVAKEFNQADKGTGILKTESKIIRFKEWLISEDKAASGYENYHPHYSAALQHAEKHAEKQGYHISDEYDHLSTPKKPNPGETVRIHYPLHKDGKPSKKHLHVSVYNRDNTERNVTHPYELTPYIA